MRTVPGFTDYKITDDGRVFSFKTKKKVELTLSLNESGYLKTSLSVNGVPKSLFVHRVVMFTFEPIEGWKKLEINHRNGVKTDNRRENLEWCDRSHNIQHSYDTGLQHKRGIVNGRSKVTEDEVRNIRVLHSNGVKTTDIMKLYPLDRANINRIISRKTWSHIS